MDYRCYNCLVRSFSFLIQKFRPDSNDNDILMKDFLTYLVELDHYERAPIVAGHMQGVMREMFGVNDLYIEEKAFANTMLLQKYDEFKKYIADSKNPFDTALRLAVAGNIIDYSANPEFDVMSTIDLVLNNDFAVDHSKMLQNDLLKAEKILYLGDNAGEIVLDKLFVEFLNRKDTVFAVRGRPVINDATISDANDVGIGDFAKVIDNGSDLPSTVLTTCSNEFRKYFNEADVIISKGQGNLEGLINIKDKNIYFLSMVKCDAIGEMLGVNKGDFVVINSSFVKSKSE